MQIDRPPPAQLSDGEFDRCRDLLADLPADGARTLFLSGSRAEGWASAGSNYNFYVVGTPPAGLRPLGGFGTPCDDQRVFSHHFVLGQDRVVVRYWRTEDVEWAARAVRTHELRPTVEIWPQAVQFLHRLVIGVPLIGANVFAGLRAAVDPELLTRYITQNRSMYAESYRTDAVTRLAAGRVHDALLQSRLAFESQVDAYLAAQGETNTQEKWRHKRVSHVAGNEALLADYRLVTLGPGAQAGSRKIEEHIATTLHLSETLNCCVQLSCRYDLLAPRRSATPGPVYHRDIGARLCRRYDGRAFAVLPDGTAVQLSPPAALVYGCTDGRTGTADIARHVERQLPTDSTERMTGLVDDVVAALRERNFLHAAPAAVGQR